MRLLASCAQAAVEPVNKVKILPVYKGHITCCCANIDEKFYFRISEQFINSGNCCAVDFGQWIGFKGAVSGCLSYCRSSLPEPTREYKGKKGGES
jgi:hypothetical protein